MTETSDTVARSRALWVLLLLVPMPSLAVFVGLIALPDSIFGRLFWAFGKIWVLLLPLVWLVWVEGGKPRLRWQNRGLGVGLLSGLAMAAVIVAVYWWIGRSAIDPQQLRGVAAQIGMDNKPTYLGLALYWILANSLLEEYVWRWFVTRQFRLLLAPAAAVIAAAAGFTLHHVVATQVYFSPLLVLLAAVGVFSGGVIWSWLYLQYRSIWPAYVSHVCADIAIFAIGYRLLFAPL